MAVCLILCLHLSIASLASALCPSFQLNRKLITWQFVTIKYGYQWMRMPHRPGVLMMFLFPFQEHKKTSCDVHGSAIPLEQRFSVGGRADADPGGTEGSQILVETNPVMVTVEQVGLGGKCTVFRRSLSWRALHQEFTACMDQYMGWDLTWMLMEIHLAQVA